MVTAGVTPNVVTYSTVITACAQNADSDRSDFWLSEMRKNGVKPNSYTYNALARQFVAKGDFQKVEDLMNDLKRSGQALDEHCLASLLSAYYNATPKETKRAEMTLLEFSEAG